MSKIQAIIFDLGGTLVEYTGGYAHWPELETPGFAAAHDYLLEHDVPIPEVERFRGIGFDLLPKRWKLATIGARNLTVASLLVDVLETLGISVNEALIREAASRYEDAVCHGAEPIAYSLQTVTQLKAAGYRLGLISNTMFSGRAHVADLSKFGLATYFGAMLFSSDVNKWKPDPAPFRQVLKQLGVGPQAAVFVGDDPAADVVGGHRAGLNTVHFTSSQRFASPDGVKPDATIASLLELPDVLQRLNEH